MNILACFATKREGTVWCFVCLDYLDGFIASRTLPEVVKLTSIFECFFAELFFYHCDVFRRILTHKLIDKNKVQNNRENSGPLWERGTVICYFCPGCCPGGSVMIQTDGLRMMLRVSARVSIPVCAINKKGR